MVEPEEEIISSYSAYVNYRDTKPIKIMLEMEILLFSLVKGIQGTKYYMGTEY